MKNFKYWIWFSKIERLGSIRKQKLLEKFNNDIEGIWNAKKEDLLKLEGIGEKIVEEILNDKYRMGIEEEIKRMEKEEVRLISICDEDYPKKLKQIYDKPICLYVKGNIKILNEFSLGIIGCRENSVYGKQIASAIGKSLAKQKITTVSGLARGIDSISQNATVKEKGKTIAVIGSGLDIIYPHENSNLAKDIIKNGGAIVSEYPLGTKPEKLHFPARNRIISGLSDGVIVVEAKKKSGTMTTVDFALEQGKTVFAIPRKYNKYKCRRN